MATVYVSLPDVGLLNGGAMWAFHLDWYTEAWDIRFWETHVKRNQPGNQTFADDTCLKSGTMRPVGRKAGRLD